MLSSWATNLITSEASTSACSYWYWVFSLANCTIRKCPAFWGSPVLRPYWSVSSGVPSGIHLLLVRFKMPSDGTCLAEGQRAMKLKSLLADAPSCISSAGHQQLHFSFPSNGLPSYFSSRAQTMLTLHPWVGHFELRGDDTVWGGTSVPKRKYIRGGWERYQQGCGTGLPGHWWMGEGEGGDQRAE